METTVLLLDRERRLRYAWLDVRDICRVLTRMAGEGAERVTQTRLWQLLAERDPDATSVTVFHGLRWEDRALKLDRVEQILSDFAANGGRLDDIYEGIVDAMVASGIVRLQGREGPGGNGATGMPGASVSSTLNPG